MTCPKGIPRQTNVVVKNGRDGKNKESHSSPVSEGSSLCKQCGLYASESVLHQCDQRGLCIVNRVVGKRNGTERIGREMAGKGVESGGT